MIRFELIVRFSWNFDRQFKFTLSNYVNLFTLLLLSKHKLTPLKLLAFNRMRQFSDLISSQRCKKWYLSQKVNSSFQLNLLDNLWNSLPRFKIQHCQMTLFCSFYRSQFKSIFSDQSLLAKHLHISHYFNLCLRCLNENIFEDFIKNVVLFNSLFFKWFYKISTPVLLVNCYPYFVTQFKLFLLFFVQ